MFLSHTHLFIDTNQICLDERNKVIMSTSNVTRPLQLFRLMSTWFALFKIIGVMTKLAEWLIARDCDFLPCNYDSLTPARTIDFGRARRLRTGATTIIINHVMFLFIRTNIPNIYNYFSSAIFRLVRRAFHIKASLCMNGSLLSFLSDFFSRFYFFAFFSSLHSVVLSYIRNSFLSFFT